MRRIAMLPFLCGILAAGDEKPAVKRFVIVYSVNNSGYVDVCGCKHKKVKQGSLSRRLTLIKTLRAEGKPLVLLDGGSCFFDIRDRSPKEFEKKQLLAKAFVIVESYNRLGYGAVAMGSSDLLLGLDNLKKLAQAAHFPVLSANFLGPDGKTVFPPSTVLEVGGVRIGVIGLVMGTLNQHYIDRVAPGCRVIDCVEAAKKEAAALKDKADLIVALSHSRKEENEAIGAEVPSISCIFDPNINYGSHSLFLADPLQYVDRFGKALVVRADGEGMRIARVDVEFEVPFGELRTSPELNRLDRGVQAVPVPRDMVPLLGRGDYNRAVVTRISIEPHFLPDPGIEALVEAWKQQDPGGLDPATLAQLKTAPLTFVGKQACVDCHEEQHAFWLTTDHAKAYKSLEDRNDHLRYDCIACHTVGFGHAFFDVRKGKDFADVQCECCHGTNPKHIDDPDGAGKWAPINENTCLTCHNENQIRVPFQYQAKIKSVSCPPMRKP